MPDPEALARITIDRLLTDAGWTVVGRDQVNPFERSGIAIREVSIPGAGETVVDIHWVSVDMSKHTLRDCSRSGAIRFLIAKDTQTP